MAACLGQAGHRIVGVDVNPAKVEALGNGRSPIVEAQVGELLAQTRVAGRLSATTDTTTAVAQTDISFICVGTPGARNGKLDLTHVERVAREIGRALKEKKTHHNVVVRSTALPGTTESLIVPAIEEASGRRAGESFTVCYNPEFMRESSAVEDFRNPPFTILGVQHPSQAATLRKIYAETPAPVFETSIAGAEMVKYASNAFHALKVSFANEIGTLCKNLNVDTEEVMEVFAADKKLNLSAAYLTPGFAFGGSCLPKDLRAIAYRAREKDLSLPLLEAVLASNAGHVDRAVEAVLRTGRKKIAVLGLSFKAGTDDLRESPQVQMIKRLLGEGCQVRVWDQDVLLGRLAGSNRQYIEEVIPHIGSLLSESLDDVVAAGEVVVIATRVDKKLLSRLLLPTQLVVDLVNLASDTRPRADAGYEGICW